MNRLNNQSEIKINLTQNYYITDKQFKGHSRTKRNSRKPRRPVVMTAITTRKCRKGVPTPPRRMTLENKYDQSRSIQQIRQELHQSKLISGRSENLTD